MAKTHKRDQYPLWEAILSSSDMIAGLGAIDMGTYRYRPHEGYYDYVQQVHNFAPMTSAKIARSGKILILIWGGSLATSLFTGLLGISIFALLGMEKVGTLIFMACGHVSMLSLPAGSVCYFTAARLEKQDRSRRAAYVTYGTLSAVPSALGIFAILSLRNLVL